MQVITSHERIRHRRVTLIAYDLLLLLAVEFFLLVAYPSALTKVTAVSFLMQYAALGLSIIGMRLIFQSYGQIWRYSNTKSYISLMSSDFVSCVLYFLLSQLAKFLPGWEPVSYVRAACIIVCNLIGNIFIRLVYTLIYENTSLLALQAKQSRAKHLLVSVLAFFSGFDLLHEDTDSILAENSRIKIAVVGAGRVGVALAEELLSNPKAVYLPVCFIDADTQKAGRAVAGLPVIAPDENQKYQLDRHKVQEVVFAVKKDAEQQKTLYDAYKNMGYKVKVYTLPVGNSSESGKMQIREFQAEELLFRQQVEYLNAQTMNYYKDKVVMVTGGGGSIGSELARQIARMQPKQLVIVDIYENNAYDIQQELKLMYGDRLNLAIEIASVRDVQQINKVFSIYKPQIVLHAAAHKHVPLMEHNCSEAVKNNVFGTWNVVNAAEKYGVEKFVMVSTDKAVNPTNVMGATKRMCEMIVLSRAASSKTAFSCTRFGNVLGSNGSVIPLFKRQIANGGPVTITDKRIIRYFMTIPEASQLVLTSGAMAKTGELFVLDMGRPVKIYDLAISMIRLSGLEPDVDIDVIETGLRPGEKLFEELLINTETLKKTDNDMIFIERDEPVSRDEIDEKLALLREALATEDDAEIYQAMKKVVPTFHSPKHVNKKALESGKYEQEASGEGSQKAVGM